MTTRARSQGVQPAPVSFDAAIFGATIGRLIRHERARNEQALQRNANLLATIQHLSSTGVFCWRVPSNEMSWSEELYRVFDYDTGVKVGLTDMAVRVHPDDSSCFRRMVAQARLGLDLDHEYRLLLPDRSVRYVHIVASRPEEWQDEVEYLGAIQDITQQRTSQIALEKVRSEVTRLARIATLTTLTASIAHEVSQPLTGILTNISACLRILAVDAPNIDNARETLHRAMRDGQRASEVITRLRAMFSNKPAAIEPLDLNEVTGEVVALMKNELRRRRTMTRLEFTASLPAVLGDKVQLQQVILNLVLNAAEAMAGIETRPRSLVLRTECDADGQVKLSVIDVGIGFAEHEVDQLFDAFYSTKSNGMGIGLSVSRSIIETLGGRLWASSNVESGATFSFSLPRVPECQPTLGLDAQFSHAQSTLISNTV